MKAIFKNNFKYLVLISLTLSFLLNFLLIITVYFLGNLNISGFNKSLFIEFETPTFLVSEAFRIIVYIYLIYKLVISIRNGEEFKIKFAVYILLLIFVVIPYIEHFQTFDSSFLNDYFDSHLNSNSISREEFLKVSKNKLLIFNIISSIILILIIFRFVLYTIHILNVLKVKREVKNIEERGY
ncbi:hypothetical protein [Mesoplasma tabanidae]|uniref:Uncharacterized protein n=1 Tax=Mesoplasma tabanidae TaxID=219745 RepID=A0A2K8P4W7_9MOLU|nr:hypothetical protein [Mesoplasma tabanidae]ATZ21787.1 hypothetical protein MTABA_v1c05950 [Mesoplasma tabanidae]